MANEDGLTAEQDSQTILSGSQDAQAAPEPTDAPPVESDGSVETPVEGSVLPKWTEQLPRDYREKFSDYESYKDFVGAAAEALELKDKAIVKPADDAPQEDWDRFYASVGRPDGPDGYELSNTDEYGEFADSFKQQAHKLGLTAQQASDLWSWYYEQDTQLIEQEKKAVQEQVQKVQEQLKTDWGDQFDAQMKNIDRFKQKYGSEELAKELQNPRVGNNIALIKAIAQAGADLAPDSLVEGTVKQETPKPKAHFEYPWMREAYPQRDF